MSQENFYKSAVVNTTVSDRAVQTNFDLACQEKGVSCLKISKNYIYL